MKIMRLHVWDESSHFSDIKGHFFIIFRTETILFNLLFWSFIFCQLPSNCNRLILQINYNLKLRFINFIGNNFEGYFQRLIEYQCLKFNFNHIQKILRFSPKLSKLLTTDNLWFPDEDGNVLRSNSNGCCFVGWICFCSLKKGSKK